MLYLDHNATTPMAPAVLEAMLPVLTNVWANPSSQHQAGQDARRVLAQARATVARALGCRIAEVIFTSGATESNHMAVRGLLGAAPTARRRVLFGSVEHASHLRLADALGREGLNVQRIPVLCDGTLDMVAAQTLITEEVALVSLMAANNETGALMSLAPVAAWAQAAGARLHVDATQLIGKLAFSFSSCGADAVSLSAHKFHGPRGAGALLLRHGVPFASPICGSQERGRRGGTENLAGIVGLAAALELLGDLDADSARVVALRDTLERGLCQALPSTHIWSANVPRLPGTSYLRFGMLSADVVLQRMGLLGIAASSGAACSSGGTAPSHVLSAMGVSEDEALCALRFSLGRSSTQEEVMRVLQALPPLLHPLLRGELLAA